MTITTGTSPLELTQNGNSLDRLEELRPSHFTNEMSENVFDRVQKRIFKYALSRTGNIQDAEDISSEVIIKAIEGISSGQYSDRGIPLMAWITRIARNETENYRRRRRINEGENPLYLLSDGQDVQAQVELAEQIRKVRVAVGLLPEAQRNVIILKFGSGLSQEEIARAVGKKVNNVRVLQHKGITRLRGLMDIDRSGENRPKPESYQKRMAQLLMTGKRFTSHELATGARTPFQSVHSTLDLLRKSGLNIQKENGQYFLAEST